MAKKRIGFLSYWGFGRGMSYVTLNYAKMLIPDYDVYIFKQGNNPISKEFELDSVNVFEYNNYLVEPLVFKKWLIENKIDAVVFNEYGQWITDPNNLIKEAKSLGVKTYGYLVMERFEDVEKYLDYDRIIAPTVTFKQFLRSEKYRKFRYIPVSIDFNDFTNIKENKGDNDEFVFFHPAGYGGVLDRKNTDNVVEAFKRLLLENPDKKIKLILTSQKELKYDKNESNIEIICKDLSRRELIELYSKVDITILPSKWETVGIPILESLAAGTPVITTNMPPMNEFVKEGVNGYLCDASLTIYPNIMIKAAEVDASTLMNKMQMSMNRFLLGILNKNSRKIALEKYDNFKNRHYFIDMLKEDLGENNE